MSVGYEMPAFERPALRAIASHWRFSGIVNARSGSRLNIESGLDNAFSGIRYQRPNKVSDDFYDQVADQLLQPGRIRAAGAGTLGDLPRNAGVGPSYWNVDLAISRLIAMGATRRLELRLESFNLLNHFNWGDPLLIFNAPTFGRITTQTGAPRIIQFGVKYRFLAGSW